MRPSILCGTLPALCLCFFSAHAWAVDLDDDLKPESTTQHLLYDAQAAPSPSNDVEARFPDEAKELRAALERHIAHANTHDLDGYMGDFLTERMRYPQIERDYAARAMALKDLKIEVQSIEFQALSRTSATLHTRQIARYIDPQGHPRVDDVLLGYRWLKDAKDQVWRIAFTERRHTAAE